jgi:cyclophilin family peptidyl-prolyl cis-trans isomerase
MLKSLIAAIALLGSSLPALAKTGAKGPPVGDERIVMHTNRGDLVIGLYDSVAPKHAAQIRKLVRLGVYDSTTIFRVEPGFVAQVCDAPNRKKPMTDEQRKAIVPIPAEFSKTLKHRKGIVSMAREDKDINSARTSFSFMLGRAENLDGQYTIVGELEYGQPMLDLIAREPVDYMNRPRTPVIVESAEVKTAAQLAEMKAAGQLRPALPPKT